MYDDDYDDDYIDNIVVESKPITFVYTIKNKILYPIKSVIFTGPPFAEQQNQFFAFEVFIEDCDLHKQ